MTFKVLSIKISGLSKIFLSLVTSVCVVPLGNTESVMRTQDSKIAGEQRLEQSDVNYADEVGHCLRDGGGVSSCLAAGAFVFLETASQKRSVPIADDLDLFENEVEPHETRTTFTLGDSSEPTDFYTLMEASTKFLQRRTLRWSLAAVYPGLELCVGPVNSGPPTIHFLLDPRQGIDERRLGTGRLLVKRAILPHILGLKVNLITIMPLVFAGLIFLTKKALVLSKFAFLIMTMLGFNVASHLSQHHITTSGYPHQGYGFNNHESYYRDFARPFNRVENTGKNFAWEETEKKPNFAWEDRDKKSSNFAWEDREKKSD